MKTDFKIHFSPTKNSGSQSKKVTLDEINQQGFDFKAHFRPDLLFEDNNWWICRKAKPWAALDCMIVDSSAEIRSSFDEFDEGGLSRLFYLCRKTTDIISSFENVEKVIIGANINHRRAGLPLDEVLLRLHLHVLGISLGEIEKMTEVNLDELEKRDPGAKDRLIDPKSEGFCRRLENPIAEIFKDNSISANPEAGGMGIKFLFPEGLEIFNREGFARAIRKIDILIQKKFPDISYSFCFLQDSGKLSLALAPRSVFGKGVLEAIGIVLMRDETETISGEGRRKREEFFTEIAKMNKAKL